MTELIQVDELEPGIVSVVLNRPERCNALNIELLEALGGELERLRREPQHRVVILQGEGSVFSSGLDLYEAADEKLVDLSTSTVRDTYNRIRESPLIVIAAVRGGAYAGGAGLMAACDFVIAADDARFGFPEARRGLLPALICGVLRNKIREADMRELFLVGESIDAERARQVGLVQRVVPADQLLDESVSAARSVLAGGPETIRLTKALLNEAYRSQIDLSGTHYIKKHLVARRSEEFREGLASFTEKRKPNWT